MLRRLFTLAAALSLLLFVATVVLWARSHWRYDQVHWQHSTIIGSWWLSSWSGEMRLRHYPDGWGEEYETRRWGFYLYGGNDIRGAGTGFYCQEWGVSDSLLVLLLSILPAYLAAPKMKRRYCVGLCGSCGYDIRATPDRCPECGTLVAKSQRATSPGVPGCAADASESD
jgi:hypothetical protein